MLKLVRGVANLQIKQGRHARFPVGIDRDDLNQQAFLLYLELRGHYDVNKAAGRPFNTWIYGMLWRRLFNYLRQEHNRARKPEAPKPIKGNNTTDEVDFRDWVDSVRALDPEAADLIQIMYENDGKVPKGADRGDLVEWLKELIHATA